MNLKQFQNLADGPAGRVLNLIRNFQGRSPFPLVLCMALTYRCNLDCPFCYRPAGERARDGDMSLADAVAIERNISGSFMLRPRIHFWGGEPTIARDFLAILRYYSKKGYRLSLTTNGLVLDDLMPELVRISSLRDINLSLNTPDYDGILRKLDLFRRRDPKGKIYITLNMPVCAENQHNLLKVAGLFASSPANCLSFQHSKLSGDRRQGLDTEVIASQILKIKKQRWKMPVVFRPDIPLRHLHAYYHDPAYPGPERKCVAPWLAPFVRPDGKVIPCDLMDEVMGNLKYESLKSIWNSAAFRRFRNRIHENGLHHAACERCDHRQYCV